VWPFRPRRKTEYHGNEAVRFAKKFLKLVERSDNGLVWHYVDLKTGAKLVMDRPNSAAQGGGSPRLRKVS
jgi:hypothetical protein